MPAGTIDLSGLPRRQQLAAAMAETLACLPFTDVRADVPGYPKPDVVQGVRADHRPSLTALYDDGRQALFEIFLPGETPDDKLASRWELFHSICRVHKGQFHLIVPAKHVPRARSLASRLQVSVYRIWGI